MRRVAVLGLLAAAPAYAQFSDEEGFQPTHLQGRLVGTTVELTARFVLDVDAGQGAETNNQFLNIPPPAIVTAATATVGGVARRLRIDAADRVEQTLVEIGETDGGRDRTWAISIAGTSNTLTVSTIAARRTRVVLDVSLELPSCFVRDMRYVPLPERWYRKLDESVRRLPRAPDTLINQHCEGEELVEDTQWLGFPSPQLTRRPAGDARIGLIAGRLSLGPDHIARVELDIARQMSEVPTDLHTAIVIDRSRSVRPVQIEAQRAIVASYLRAAPPHSRVQVIGYAREAQALLPNWTAAAAAAPRVDREIRALAPRNGSNIDAGLAEAAIWLAHTDGTRRVIVFSDDRLAQRLDDQHAALHRLLPPDTLVHVVSLDSDLPGLERDDELVLAPLAKATQGIAVTGALDEDGAIDATKLVRPVSLDHITVRAPGWEAFDVGRSSCSFTMVFAIDQGSSCVWWAKGNVVAGPITVEGFVWGRKVTRVVRPDRTHARTLARVLSATQPFEADLQALVDRAAFAVNQHWSLIATWGGKSGYADQDSFGTIGLGRIGSSSHDFVHTIGTGTGSRSERPALDLRKQFETSVRLCTRTTGYTIIVETTHEEIVDVTVEIDANDTVRTCITDAVWDTTLAIPNAPAHATTRVYF